MFIKDLTDPEVQKELLKQTVEPRQALELAKNVELVMRNQHQIQQHNKTLIPASVNTIPLPDFRTGNFKIISTNKVTILTFIVQILIEVNLVINEKNASPKPKPETIVVC